MKESTKQNMREKILDASIKLFGENGYSGLSMRKITSSIGYSVRTTYIYFKNKNEILFALHERGFNMLIERQKATMAVKDPLFRLVKQLREIIEFAKNNPEYYNLMFIDKNIENEIEQKGKWNKGSECFAMLKDNIDECINAGRLEKENLEIVSYTIWSMVHGLCSSVLAGRAVVVENMGEERLIDQCLNYVFFKMNSSNKTIRAK